MKRPEKKRLATMLVNRGPATPLPPWRKWLVAKPTKTETITIIKRKLG